MDPSRRLDSGTLSLTWVMPASREAVFAAWTTAESVRRWMCPIGGSVALAELDVRVGGAFRVDMIVDGGERVSHTGVYRQISAPDKLVFTWVSASTWQRATLVSVELRDLDGKTELTLTQTLLPDEEAVRKHTHGWTQILEQLAEAIRPGPRSADT